MATVVSEFGYDHELYENIPYEQQKILKEKLNTEFNNRIGELLPIYNIMDKKFNKENGRENVDIDY